MTRYPAGQEVMVKQDLRRTGRISARWRSPRQPLSSAPPEKTLLPLAPMKLPLPCCRANAVSLLVVALLSAWSWLGGAAAASPPAIRESASGGAQIEPAIQRVYPALVRIYVVVEEPSGGRMERARAAGSGAIISKEGHVVTNHHVAGDAVRMSCTLPDGEEVEAVRLGSDPLSDIAVLKLKLATRKRPDAPLAVAVWGDSDRLKVGDVVLAMGCPMAISQSVTKGIVSNTRMIMPRSMEGHFRLDGESVGQIVRWIGHDAVIFGGNSGGPLVNLEGEIVGINEISLGSLGGAIPSNLARDVVRQLIEHGRVRRSWIGIEFQPRLKSGTAAGGVLVAGVVERSPADRAGIKAGDVVTRFRGQPVNAELPEHLPLVNQAVFAAPVGQSFEVAFLRDGREHVVQIKTRQLERAQGDPVELKDWGLAVRKLTLMMALERHRKNTTGVLIDSVRGGGGAATAKLPLEDDDVILEVDGKPTPDIAALKKITEKIVEGKTERVSVLVQFERETKQYLTVVKVGKEENKNRPASAAKPWASFATQVLTSDLAESLQMVGRHGVRVTEVFKGKAGDRAGVKVGDIVLAVGDKKVEAYQPGDREIFDTMIRRLSLGDKADLKIIRDGKPITIAMTLEAPPLSDENVKRMTDTDFEMSARELSYNDRIDMQIPEGLEGILLQRVETGGWASLGGLHGNDFVMSIDGHSTPTVAAFKAQLDRVRKEKPRRVVFFIRRGIHTHFCEIEPDYR
jgi:serine protease Do